MRTAVQDFRYALRMLRVESGFHARGGCRAGAGDGANTAIFSVVNAVLLQPLPYPHPERMVVQLLVQANWGTYRYTSVPRFNAYRALTQVFEEVAAYDWNGGAGVSLSRGLWLRRFGGDRPTRAGCHARKGASGPAGGLAGIPSPVPRCHRPDQQPFGGAAPPGFDGGGAHAAADPAGGGRMRAPDRLRQRRGTATGARHLAEPARWPFGQRSGRAVRASCGNC